MRSIIKNTLLLLNSIIQRDYSAKILFYHDVGKRYTPMGTEDSLFWAHMECLKHFNHHLVAFDDGFRGIWDAREKFLNYKIRPIVFVAINLIGQPHFLTWDEIRVLQNKYGFEFQCHTWSHQTLIGPLNSDLPDPESPHFRTDAWYSHELLDSKNELEHQLNITTDDNCQGQKHVVTSLCFPVGYFNNEVIRRCANFGYVKLYASFPGNMDEGLFIPEISVPSTVNLIPRCLCQSLSLQAFKSVIAGGMNPFRNHYLKKHFCE